MEDKTPYNVPGARHIITDAIAYRNGLLRVCQEERDCWHATATRLAAKLTEAQERIRELEAMLRRLEWQADYLAPIGWTENQFCPVCAASKSVGHEDDCALAALLADE